MKKPSHGSLFHLKKNGFSGLHCKIIQNNYRALANLLKTWPTERAPRGDQ